MTKIHDQINHELSNLLSYIQMTIQESKLDKRKKDKIQHWINLAGTLINFQEIYSKKKFDLSLEPVAITPLLKPTIALNHVTAEKKGVKVDIKGKDFNIKVDKFFFTEGFDLLLKYLISVTDHIAFTLKPRTRQIDVSFKCSAPECIELHPLIESLQRDNLNNMNIPLQLALKLFSMQNISVKPKSGGISLIFKK